MKRPTFKKTGSGAILCDASIAAQVDDSWFDAAFWRTRGGAVASAGGRGAAWRVQTGVGAAVLRHYRRGGAVATLLGDRYLWRGAERTRPFAEFRLLQHLHELQLPVPQPLAGRYRRSGLFYRADLLTRLIPQAHTLAELLAAGAADAALMRQLGATIARFHACGAWHPDLNAHNILWSTDRVYLIDFDRGELRPVGGGWAQQNLVRLRRSLLKLGAGGLNEAAFEAILWQPLQSGYAAADGNIGNLSSAGPPP